MENLKRGRDNLSQINHLLLEKERIEDELDSLIDGGVSEAGAEERRTRIKKIDEKLKKTAAKYHAPFNPHWGELMRTGVEESLFAAQVAKYACIYRLKLATWSRSVLESIFVREGESSPTTIGKGVGFFGLLGRYQAVPGGDLAPEFFEGIGGFEKDVFDGKGGPVGGGVIEVEEVFVGHGVEVGDGPETWGKAADVPC